MVAIFAISAAPLFAATYTFQSGALAVDGPVTQPCSESDYIPCDVTVGFTFSVFNDVFHGSETPTDVFFYDRWDQEAESSEGLLTGSFVTDSITWSLTDPRVFSGLEATIAPNGDLLSVRVWIDNDRPDVGIFGTTVSGFRVFGDDFYSGEGVWTIDLGSYVAPVPLPAGFALLLTALGGFGGLALRRRGRDVA
jgi:hypothetical protein